MDRTFEASDLIEVMDRATNYNAFLIDQLVDWAAESQRVLDFGAGNGRFAGALAERGFGVIALEPDLALRTAIAGQGIDTASSLGNLSPESLDGVYSINVLEHIEDDRGILGSFYDLLRPGGGLFIYVPAFPILYSANDARVGHVRRYRRRALSDLTRSTGFEIESCAFVDCLGFPAGLMYRYFGDPDGGLNLGAIQAYDRVLFPISRVLDRALSTVVGKNLLLRARKPAYR